MSKNNKVNKLFLKSSPHYIFVNVNKLVAYLWVEQRLCCDRKLHPLVDFVLSFVMAIDSNAIQKILTRTESTI